MQFTPDNLFLVPDVAVLNVFELPSKSQDCVAVAVLVSKVSKI